MCGPEMVTDFTLAEATVQALMKEITAHCKRAGVEPEEYGFNVSPSLKNDAAATVPAKWAYLIAYAVEGGNEGYYVHCGAILRSEGRAAPAYMDFGFAKTYSAESAYSLAREAQRFLTAAQWN